MTKKMKGYRKRRILKILIVVFVITSIANATRISINLGKFYELPEQDILNEQEGSYCFFRTSDTSEKQVDFRFMMLSGEEEVLGYANGKVVQVNFKKFGGDAKVIFWNEQGFLFVADSARGLEHQFETDGEELQIAVVGKYYIGKVMITGVEKL